jgi:hypothetical protein
MVVCSLLNTSRVYPSSVVYYRGDYQTANGGHFLHLSTIPNGKRGGGMLGRTLGA